VPPITTSAVPQIPEGATNKLKPNSKPRRKKQPKQHSTCAPIPVSSAPWKLDFPALQQAGTTAREIKQARSPSQGNKSEAEQLDAGLALLVDILKRKRKRRRIKLATLARRAGVPVKIIRKLEAYQLNSVGLWDLLSIGTALGSRLTVDLAPVRPKLPKTNAEILSAFDKLIKSRDCNPFVRSEPDKEHPWLRWDIVGHKKRNWLLVVVSHRRRKLRFAKITDQPGGWAIAGQIWGIDAETDAIARELSDRLFKEHRAELVGPPTARKQVAATGSQTHPNQTQTNQTTPDPLCQNKPKKQN
jgi:hypothetical protein